MSRKASVPFSPELAEEIVRRVSAGEPLTEVLIGPDMPTRMSVYRWRSVHKNFGASFDEAMTEGLEIIAEEILSMARECHGKSIPEQKIVAERIKVLKFYVDSNWARYHKPPQKLCDMHLDAALAADAKPDPTDHLSPVIPPHVKVITHAAVRKAFFPDTGKSGTIEDLLPKGAGR